MQHPKQQNKHKNTLNNFLNYCATNPEAQIIYRASDMQLEIDCDAAYLVTSKARSRAAGYHYLVNYDGKLCNGPIYVLSKVIKAVMSSEAEAESESLFLNAGEAVQYIKTLEELEHIQHPVRLRTDNKTATGIANKTIKVSKEKKWDMHDWWMIDRIEQGQFTVERSKGKHYISDYFTKRHPSTNQKKVRPIYNYKPGVSPTSLQGCIEILEQAHNLNNPTCALNCLNAQNSGRSININNMNTLQSALQQLDIEQQ